MVKNINDLNSIHIDVLREIGNIGAGNAATALAKLLNRKIDMDIPRVKIMDFREVSETLGGAELPVAGIMLKVTGDLTGNILFVLKQQAAVILVNMLMGKPLDSIDDTDESYHEFDEMEISALKEMGIYWRVHICHRCLHLQISISRLQCLIWLSIWQERYSVFRPSNSERSATLFFISRLSLQKEIKGWSGISS